MACVTEKLKRRKVYDLKFKLDAVEFAEMSFHEKAAKKFQVHLKLLIFLLLNLLY